MRLLKPLFFAFALFVGLAPALSAHATPTVPGWAFPGDICETATSGLSRYQAVRNGPQPDGYTYSFRNGVANETLGVISGEYTSVQTSSPTVQGWVPWDYAMEPCMKEPPTGCNQGQVQTFNPTTGWGWIKGFSSDGRALVEGAPGRMAGDGNTAPETICDGACQWVADGGVLDHLVAKDAGPTGMHRVSVEQKYMSTGGTCTGLSPDLQPTLTPTCPGTLGTINGKTVCLANDGTKGTDLSGKSVGTGSPTFTGTPTHSVDGSGNPEKIGPNGETAGKSGDNKTGAGGGSTPGSPGSTLPGGTSTVGDGTGTVSKFGGVNTGGTPAVPLLYERKYKTTPGEQWLARMGTATATLTAMGTSFTPGWTDNAASCPQFSVNLNVGIMDLGDYTTNIPCNVWAFCRIVIIISALFLARSLIFGG